MHTRLISSSQEALPVIGPGTCRGFDVTLSGGNAARLPGVLEALFASGGRVVDSSPMYGRAERVAGELLATSQPPAPAFLATKVWTSGREAGIRQMEQSFRLLRTDCIDLMQIHYLVDWKVYLPTLREMKASGRIRYISITYYSSSAYDTVESVLKSTPLDFLQINYALDDRLAEERLLPLARDKGMAVLCNMPFGGGGGLLRHLRSTPLPGWAANMGATSRARMAPGQGERQRQELIAAI